MREEAASQPALLAALTENPDDLETLQIYGDWLAERGDPWGQIVLIQHALETLPRFGHTERRDALQREDLRLRFMHATRLWGALGDRSSTSPRRSTLRISSRARCALARAAARTRDRAREDRDVVVARDRRI